MEVIPAVDIQRGRCVRLTRGDFTQEEVFASDPLAAARRWESEGAELLHVIDLDGAARGFPVNAPLIKRMAAELGIPIQVGGGLRTFESARDLLEAEVHRVFIGTAAVRQPDLISRLSKEFGRERIGVAVDVKGGAVAVNGWRNCASISPSELAAMANGLGAGFLLITCIDRDGTLQGANIELARRMANSVEIPVIYSGGIATLNDIRTLGEAGAWGAIVGKALYKGNFTLKEAIACSRRE